MRDLDRSESGNNSWSRRIVGQANRYAWRQDHSPLVFGPCFLTTSDVPKSAVPSDIVHGLAFSGWGNFNPSWHVRLFVGQRI